MKKHPLPVSMICSPATIFSVLAYTKIALVYEWISQMDPVPIWWAEGLCAAGGWSAVQAMRKGMERLKGDERILGDGYFVEAVFNEANERLEKKYRLRFEGDDFQWLTGSVAGQLGMEPEDVPALGKYPQNMRARSLLCCWAVRGIKRQID